MKAAAFSEKRPLSVLLIDLDGDPQAGLQFAEKAAEESARINVIFMASSQDYAMQAFRCRPSGYLIKPVTRESLFAEMNCLRYAVEGWTAAENSVKPE